jgi:P pilus assembly chaperone PapD
VDRLEIVFQPRGGDARVGVINLRNTGNKPVQAQVRLEDWDRSEGGTNNWYSEGTLAGSCGKLLRVFPATVNLDPGASEAVRVVMDSAAMPSTECWAAAVVETVQPRTISERAINYLLRTAVKIYIDPPAISADGEVSALRVVHAPGAPADSIDLVFQNTGGRHLAVRGSMEFRRGDNSLAAKVDLPPLYTLPGARSRACVGIPKLPPGRYVALAILDYGGDQLAAAQAAYEVP